MEEEKCDNRSKHCENDKSADTKLIIDEKIFNMRSICESPLLFRISVYSFDIFPSLNLIISLGYEKKEDYPIMQAINWNTQEIICSKKIECEKFRKTAILLDCLESPEKNKFTIVVNIDYRKTSLIYEYNQNERRIIFSHKLVLPHKVLYFYYSLKPYS